MAVQIYLLDKAEQTLCQPTTDPMVVQMGITQTHPLVVQIMIGDQMDLEVSQMEVGVVNV